MDQTGWCGPGTALITIRFVLIHHECPPFEMEGGTLGSGARRHGPDGEATSRS